MSLDKLLHKIQADINELAKSLESFMEDTIQPTVDECENLQKQLYNLQESLAIYKYQKQNKELSPSFNIHAKISELEVPEKPQVPVAEEKKEVVVEVKKNVEEPEIPSTETPKRSTALPAFTVGLNDKFRFINELFSQNNSEYSIAMEQLNNLKTWHDAEIYLNSLRDLYEWKSNAEVVKYIYALAKKRFD